MSKLRKGWEIKTAEDVCLKISKGTTPSKSEVSNNGNIPFLRVNNLSFNGILDKSSSLIFVSEQAHNQFLARSIVYPNDILMNIVGPPLGKIVILDESYPEYNINQAVLFYRIDNSKINTKYFYYYLSSYIAQEWLISHSKKTSGQQNLTIDICKKLPIPVPPLPDQIKIAEILSTWDNAIQTTEKQIANSQQQKKALMQMLLSGEKRVGGFSGEWNTAKLAELAAISKGTQRNKDTLSETGLYPVINGGIEPSGYTDQSNSSKNTITISEGGNSCGYVAFQKQDFWCGGHCYALENVQIDNLFLYQLLKANEESIMRLRVGSGLPNIQKKSLEGFSLRYPKDMIEQQKIAEILTTADQEIEALQRKLECLKLEKRALMQGLL